MGFQEEIGDRGNFHLKSIQDLAVYDQLRHLTGKKIAEVGGGDSRVLSRLAKSNSCYNIEKFEGDGGGPIGEIKIGGVQNIKVFLGEFSNKISPDFFDAVFSISVVEHVPTEMLNDFINDGVRILKPGGLWLHAIDMYITETPDNFRLKLFNIYRDWLKHPDLVPCGEIYQGPPKFTCDMASNPDNVMHLWGQNAPMLTDLRKRAQSVSILLAARRATP